MSHVTCIFLQVSHVICLTPTSPALNMSMRGELSYRDSMSTSRRLFFDMALLVSDVIRFVSGGPMEGVLNL